MIATLCYHNINSVRQANTKFEAILAKYFQSKENDLSFFELIIVGIGLSMDAFAVAVCKGLSMKKKNNGAAAVTALFFGVFQALMPLIGYLLGIQFSEYITAFDHWLAFALLSIIGINMIRESRQKYPAADPSFKLKNMLILSLATSIDAFAIGITFAFLEVNIFPACAAIGIVTFILSFIGVRIGNIFGVTFKSKAEFTGGLILILMGLKILLEHLNIISF